MNTAVNISGAPKIYDRSHVVKDFSWSIDEGEILGLLGSNGAGKSTILDLDYTVLELMLYHDQLHNYIQDKNEFDSIAFSR